MQSNCPSIFPIYGRCRAEVTATISDAGVACGEFSEITEAGNFANWAQTMALKVEIEITDDSEHVLRSHCQLHCVVDILRSKLIRNSRKLMREIKSFQETKFKASLKCRKRNPSLTGEFIAANKMFLDPEVQLSVAHIISRISYTITDNSNILLVYMVKSYLK